MILFQPNFFWMFPVTVLIEVEAWDFDILILNLKQDIKI